MQQNTSNFIGLVVQASLGTMQLQILGYAEMEVTGLIATGYLCQQFYRTMASDRVFKFGAIISNMEVTKKK